MRKTEHLESLRDDLMLAGINALENSTDPDDAKLWRQIADQFDRLLPCITKREVDGEWQSCQTLTLSMLLDAHLPPRTRFPRLPNLDPDRKRPAGSDVLKEFFSPKSNNDS